MTESLTASEIERELSLLRTDENSTAHQRLQFLTERTELLFKIQDLKIKQQEALESKSRKIGKIISNPLLITIIAGLLTSLVAPFIIESSRKQDTIRNTKFEIIERLNNLLWGYRASAEFLIWDFAYNELDKTAVQRHIDDYDQYTRTMNKDYNAEAFRARMYFNDPQVYELLKHTYNELNKLDEEILAQVKAQNKDPGNRDAGTEERWRQIHSQLYKSVGNMEVTLDKLFDQVR